MGCEIVTFPFFIQIVSCLIGLFAFTYGWYLVSQSHDLPTVILNFFIIILSVLLLAVEIYMVIFMKYFGFLLKLWGKSIMYICVGCLIFNTDELAQVIIASCFWVLAVIYFIMNFVISGVNPPVFQRNTIPNVTTSSDDYYGTDGQGMYEYQQN